MKGALLSVNASARLHDLSHAIPPQNVLNTAFFLKASVPYFPPGTLHIVVVDPGVGTKRAILYAEAGQQRFLAPDNGCLSPLFDVLGSPSTVRHVKKRDLWRTPVSDSFHGRDIFAPVAGHLSLGLRPAKLGPVVQDWVRLAIPKPKQTAKGVRGEVIYIDSFGNLITNIPASAVSIRPTSLVVGRRRIQRFAWVRTYGEAKPGDLAVLISSFGYLELAIAQGSAARRLRANVGTAVYIGFHDVP
jgi:S-adenosyl-L-methionine hydrolase (adenosine-forming)